MEIDNVSVEQESTIPGFSLDAETFKRILPLEYHRRFATEGIRPDGRKALECRDLQLNKNPIHNAAGSALVKLGDTRVVCGIRVEIAQPDAMEPSLGLFVPNLDLPALCSSQFRPGPPGELSQSLIQTIHDVFKQAEVLDLNQLCIVPGKAVWVIYADIVCLNYEGNVLDAAVFALLSALKQTTLPNVRLENEGLDERYRIIDETTIPLNINRMPFCFSFCVLENELLADPTSDEDTISSSRIHIFLDEDETICGLYSSRLLSEKFLDEALNHASSQLPAISQHLAPTTGIAR